ncbi:hypothetical protein LBMAG15_02390 [Actinomycetes bacterium]|nr:hypothetical protein LBMAG15_02390 [Actinomycetes bacterium]
MAAHPAAQRHPPWCLDHPHRGGLGTHRDHRDHLGHLGHRDHLGHLGRAPVPLISPQTHRGHRDRRGHRGRVR